MTAQPVVQHTVRRVTLEGIASKRLPVGRKGTVLFAMYASVGAVSVLGTEASWNQAILGMEPIPSLADQRFLVYWLLSLRPRLQEYFRSNTQDNLNAEQVGNLPYPVLQVAQQRAIADFLDAETARIDALIEKKRRMIELLGERDGRMVDECFAPRNGENLVRLARFAEVQTGITLHDGRKLGGDAVTLPYLRVANVQPGWLDLSEVKSVTVPKDMALRSKLRSDDVLMTEDGDRDKLGRGTVWGGEIPDCLHQNHVFAVRPDPFSLNSDYLGYLTRTSHARAYFEMTGVQSTNLASTSASKVSDYFRMPTLSVEEQHDRVRRYQKFAHTNRQISTALTKQIELLTEHRQALITAAVTGQVEVPGT